MTFGHGKKKKEKGRTLSVDDGSLGRQKRRRRRRRRGPVRGSVRGPVRRGPETLGSRFRNPTVRADSHFRNPIVRAGSAGPLKCETVVGRTDRRTDAQHCCNYI